MDATATTAIVRAEPTSLFTFANSAVAAGNLQVNLVPVSAPLARVEEIEVVTTTTPFSWGADNSVARLPSQFDVDVSALGIPPLIGSGDPVRMDGYFTKVDFGTFDLTAATLAKLSNSARNFTLRDRNIAGITVDTVVTSTQIVFTVTGTPGAGETAAFDLGLLGIVNLPDPSTVTIGPGATAVFYCLQDATAGTVKSFPTFGTFLTAFEAALAGGTTVVKDFIAAGSFDVGSGTLSATTVTAIVQ
jgi:hypothetical protein